MANNYDYSSKKSQVHIQAIYAYFMAHPFEVVTQGELMVELKMIKSAVHRYISHMVKIKMVTEDGHIKTPSGRQMIAYRLGYRDRRIKPRWSNDPLLAAFYGAQKNETT